MTHTTKPCKCLNITRRKSTGFRYIYQFKLRWTALHGNFWQQYNRFDIKEISRLTNEDHTDTWIDHVLNQLKRQTEHNGGFDLHYPMEIYKQCKSPCPYISFAVYIMKQAAEVGNYILPSDKWLNHKDEKGNYLSHYLMDTIAAYPNTIDFKVACTYTKNDIQLDKKKTKKLLKFTSSKQIKKAIKAI